MVPSDFDKTDRSKNGFFDELAIIHDLKRRKPLSSFLSWVKLKMSSRGAAQRSGGLTVAQPWRTRKTTACEGHTS